MFLITSLSPIFSLNNGSIKVANSEDHKFVILEQFLKVFLT